MFEYLLQDGEAARPGPPWEAVPRAMGLTLWRVGKIVPPLVQLIAPTGRIEERLARGELVVYRRARPVSVRASRLLTERPPAEAAMDLADLADAETDDEVPASTPAPGRPTWIEIVVVDADDVPIAGRRWVLKLPDGSRREGTLDATGVIRFDDVEAGACALFLPTDDEMEWAPHG